MPLKHLVVATQLEILQRPTFVEYGNQLRKGRLPHCTKVQSSLCVSLHALVTSVLAYSKARSKDLIRFTWRLYTPPMSSN